MLAVWLCASVDQIVASIEGTEGTAAAGKKEEPKKKVSNWDWIMRKMK